MLFNRVVTAFRLLTGKIGVSVPEECVEKIQPPMDFEGTDDRCALDLEVAKLIEMMS